MTEHDASAPPAVLPVLRTKAQTQRFYDRISRIYGWMTVAFERRHGEKALELLSIREGEIILEIGPGSGHCLRRIAGLVGEGGNGCGIDISAGMLKVTRNKLLRSGMAARAGLCCADAVRLPLRDGSFDAILMVFTLELFDTLEIPQVLQESMRVLKPGGRITVASLSREGKKTTAMRLYEWVHRKWPQIADCRPIYAERSMKSCGYIVASGTRAQMAGLPLEIVSATKPDSRTPRQV